MSEEPHSPGASAAADERWALGILVAVGHFALGALTAIEKHILTPGIAADEQGMLALLAASSLLGWLVAVVWTASPTTSLLRKLAAGLRRFSVVLLVTFCNLAVVVDYQVYRAFGTSLDLGVDAAAIPTAGVLLDSLRAEIDGNSLLNFALLLATLLPLWLPPVRRRFVWIAALPGSRRLWLATLASAAAVPLVIVQNGTELVAGDPATAAIASLIRTDREGPTTSGPLLELYRSRSGAAEPDAPGGRELERLGAAARRLERPNILLITLESVAARQLLYEGELQPELTPNLARLAEHGVLFDQLYTCAPETMRSQVQLNTGLALTWDPDDPERGRRFAGPTFAKELQRAGYRTAYVTAGDLDYTGTRDYLPPVGYDLLLDADALPAEVREQGTLNSWGVRDSVMFAQALAWLDQGEPSHPFFLQMLTLGTHHPYSLPEGSPFQPSARGNRTRYLATLRQTDAEIGELLAELQRRGRLANTLVVITGDHGEAFGDIHPGATIHGRNLWDEAVRTFLLISLPGSNESLRLKRIGSVGDIAVTILSLAGVAAEVPGRNLLADRFAVHLVYSHQRNLPTRCALRDGRWRYVGAFADERDVGLFDLEADPDEQRNRAAEHPERIAEYRSLCNQWYAAGTREYLVAAEGQAVDADTAYAAGPRQLRLGTGTGPRFRPADTVPWDRDVTAVLELVPYQEDRMLAFEWQSPGGVRRRTGVRVPAGVSRTTRSFRLHPPEAGTWQLHILDQEREALVASVTMAPRM